MDSAPRAAQRSALPVRYLLRNTTFFLLVALLQLPSGPDLHAAEKKETRPPLVVPPPPVPQQVKVPRGRKIDVPLRIFGKQNEPLRYLIRNQPTHGKVTAPRVTDREVSTVTYEPPADLAITADSFTYSVQTSAGVSAPVAVTIAITDEPPRLIMPNALDFGEVIVGNAVARELQLRNGGGGMASGELRLEAPWKTEGANTYRLGADESAAFKVLFTPAEAGEFRGEIRFTSAPEHTTLVRGTAAMPVAAIPSAVELKQEAGSTERSGAFELVNRTDEERVFQVRSGGRLITPTTVTVPPQGRISVTLKVPAADVSLARESLRIEASGFSLEVPVRAAAAEAMLQVTPPSLPFGRLDARRGGQLPISVKNVGGKPVKVGGEIALPFSLAPVELELGPGEEKQLAVTLQPGSGGNFRTWLKLTGGSSISEIEVTAELVEATVSQRPRATAKRTNTTGRTAPSIEEPTPWMPDLELAKTIQVKEVKPTSAKLEWPADLSPTRNFRIERLMLLLNSAGEPQTVWRHVPTVAFSQEGTSAVARVTELHPQQSQTLRVVPLNAAGDPLKSLFRVDFFTPPKARLFPKPGLLTWLILGLVICVGAVFWKRARARKEFSPAKTQRLV